ncbi:hypothetical protein [Stutzerimonas tarimensis]|uniref:DUF4212 domain-containing protein n=1 Tax=Stutzerimonas tarimensis TaxID=1507735 RepID=A0ABV7T788_9GAMM
MQKSSAMSAVRPPVDRAMPSYKTCAPLLGIVPRSRFGKLMFGWAMANVVLTLLPLFIGIGNSAQMVGNILPGTIFYSYVVFTSNCLFAWVFYLRRARPWADSEMNKDDR